MIPGATFDYIFASQGYAAKFATEDNIRRLAVVFTTLAIIISCLGLFGLASFVAEQRTKEIGIRKVLGAFVPNLWRMLSGEFVAWLIVRKTIYTRQSVKALKAIDDSERENVANKVANGQSAIATGKP